MKQARRSPHDKRPNVRRRYTRSPICRQTRGEPTRSIFQFAANGERDASSAGASINDYLRQLEYMVPTIRTGERLDGLEILQRVIDYILILEEALGIITVPECSLAPCSEQRQMLK